MSLSSQHQSRRPDTCESQAEDPDDGYASVHNGQVMADESEVVDEPVDEVVGAEDDEVVQVPQPHSEPRAPSARERARHNLMKFPYRRWCRQCVAGRLNDVAHKRSTFGLRSIPVIHLDYCFPREAQDQDLLTCLVGRVQQGEMTSACPCGSKGVDPPRSAETQRFHQEL